MDSYDISIPKKMEEDLRISISMYPPSVPIKHAMDNFMHITYKIIRLNSLKRLKNLQKVPISSIILRQEVGKHYKRYLEYLIAKKFIFTDNYYVVAGASSGKCKCYSLGKKYSASKLKKYTITKKSLVKKFIERNEKKFEMVKNDGMLSLLGEMMKNFEIDMEAATKHIDEMVKKKKMTPRQAHLEMEKCAKIGNKGENSLFLIRDSYGRVHTNFTNISKSIRVNHLSMGGERLVEIDIISSQPALFCTMVKKYLADVTEEAAKKFKDPTYVSPMELDKRGIDVRDKYVGTKNKYTGKHMYENEFVPRMDRFGYGEYIDMLEDAVKELEKYENILIDGIYEFFRDKWNKMFDEFITRDDVKKKWVRHLFGRSNAPHSRGMELIWREEFPLINKIMGIFKEDNYKTLAHELQRRESDIIFNQLCPKINDLGVQYITVHDCVAVRESDADKVRKEFKKVLNKNEILTGVSN